jgi:hypothetical protein
MIFRIDLYRTAEVDDGLIKFQLVDVSAAAIVESRRSRFKLDRFRFVGDSAVELVCVVVCPAATDVAMGVFGIEPDRLRRVSNRASVFLYLVIATCPVGISPGEIPTFPFARIDRCGAGSDLFAA